MANKNLRSRIGIELLSEGYLDEASDIVDAPVESAIFYVDQATGILYIRVPGVDDAADTWVAQGQLVNTYASNPENVGTTAPGTAGALASRGDHVHGHGDQGALANAHDAVGIDVADAAGYFDATDVEAALAEAYADFLAHLADTVDAHDASAISILDTAGDFTATDVEGALAELQSDNEAHAAAAAAHHSKYTDAEAVSAIEATANYIDLTDGGETALHSHAGGVGVTDADYLVGTAHAGLSAEIVVGTAPGGELGGTWASPTVDATHSGSSHAATQAAAEATAAGALSSHAGDADAHHAQVHNLDSHSDVVITAPGAGQHMMYDGAQWINDSYIPPNVAHAVTTGQTPDDHHNQSHDHSSASDGVGLAPQTVALSKYLRLASQSVVTPTADMDDLAIGDASIIRIATDVDGRNLSGFAGGAAGRVLIVINTSGVNALDIEEENIGSLAANRIAAVDITSEIRPNGSVIFVYDGTASRWQIVANTSLDYGETADMTAQAFGDTASGGVSKEVAPIDHRHAMMADPVTAHVAAGDPHTGYVLEAATPGGELGGTYASPTVDTTHSGSSHASTQAAAEATAAGALSSHAADPDVHFERVAVLIDDTTGQAGIVTSTWTKLTFTSGQVAEDTVGLTDDANDEVDINGTTRPGIYRFNLHVEWASNATGQRLIRLESGGVEIARASMPAHTLPLGMGLTFSRNFTTATPITCWVWHNKGSNLDVSNWQLMVEKIS